MTVQHVIETIMWQIRTGNLWPVTLANGSATIITSQTLTAVSGHLLIHASFDEMTATTACAVGPYDIIYGVSVDTSASIQKAAQLRIPDASTANQQVVGGSFNFYVTATAASHTVYLLAIGTQTSCQGASGTLTVESTGL